jgi:hypothetical protein
VEAEIGREFERGGLEEAFAGIEQRITPTFERQEQNRRKRLIARREPQPPPAR